MAGTAITVPAPRGATGWGQGIMSLVLAMEGRKERRQREKRDEKVRSLRESLFEEELKEKRRMNRVRGSISDEQMVETIIGKARYNEEFERMRGINAQLQASMRLQDLESRKSNAQLKVLDEAIDTVDLHLAGLTDQKKETPGALVDEEMKQAYATRAKLLQDKLSMGGLDPNEAEYISALTIPKGTEVVSPTAPMGARDIMQDFDTMRRVLGTDEAEQALITALRRELKYKEEDTRETTDKSKPFWSRKQDMSYEEAKSLWEKGKVTDEEMWDVWSDLLKKENYRIEE